MTTGLFERLEGVDAEMARREQEAAGQFGDATSAEDLADAPVEDTSIVSFNAQEAHDAAKISLDFLAALASPLTFKYCFPPVFISAWLWLTTNAIKKREFPQLALGLPRGFGKTTLIKLFILYCVLFTNKKYILIVNATAALAKRSITDVEGFLDEVNIKRIFGDWNVGMVQDTQEIKRFGFRGRNITIQGIGAGGAVRGTNVHNERPDLIIFDDIQSREDADSELVSTALETWMLGTAMKAKSPQGCMFLFIANMYPTKWSLLRRLKANPTWVKFIAGGILANGESLWEELQPIEQLHKEFENDLAAGHPEIFYSEVLNDENAAVNNLVDFSKLPIYTQSDDAIPEGNFVFIDPAGYKKKSDEVAVGYFEVHSSKPVMRKLKSARMSPADTIRTAITFCLENNCRLVAIESVGYQSTLLYWFNFICQQLGIQGIHCVEVYPGSNSKNSRILAMFKQYQAGDVLVHPSLRPEVHSQMVSFNPLKTTNTDDILDLLTYPHKVIEMYGEYVVAMGEISSQEFEALEVLDDNCSYWEPE